MPVLISLLRGVNVGGNHRIRMDALRALYESLGFEDSRTFIQSGNVLFKTGERDLEKVAHRIEEAIHGQFGFHSSVILRTAGDLAGVIAGNPFAGRTDIEPAKLSVTFLASEPSPEAGEKLRTLPTPREELRLHGRELYIYFRDGMGRSKLSGPAIDKALRIPGTARNWNTVLKLHEMAAALEG